MTEKYKILARFIKDVSAETHAIARRNGGLWQVPEKGTTMERQRSGVHSLSKVFDHQ